jgi:polyhydroxybutyrate depolymerase
MRSLALACLLLLAACSTAPGSAAGIPAGSSTRTVTVGGMDRTFRVYRPATLDTSRPVPLVLMIHGGGGSAADAERSYGWDAEADRAGFVVAYPDGISHGWTVGGGCCRRPGDAGVDDVAYVEQLVADLGAVLPVDPARTYATGISEGGMLSYRLACDTSLFAAVGPDSATLLGECPAPRPASVIHIHGTADTRIPYDGSAGKGVYHIHGPSAPALDATWRAVDSCAAPTVTTAGVVTTSVAGCADGRAVELVAIDGAGHQWPGRPCTGRCVAGIADPPSTALDATDTIWRFFAAHPKPAA